MNWYIECCLIMLNTFISCSRQFCRICLYHVVSCLMNLNYLKYRLTTGTAPTYVAQVDLHATYMQLTKLTVSKLANAQDPREYPPVIKHSNNKFTIYRWFASDEPPIKKTNDWCVPIHPTDSVCFLWFVSTHKHLSSPFLMMIESYIRSALNNIKTCLK